MYVLLKFLYISHSTMENSLIKDQLGQNMQDID
jgi:hypothetical protein